MAKGAAKWKHDDLMRDLADRLLQPDRMVWTDMQMGPAGSPRPDVFTMQKSYSQPKPRAYEIKVSRSDFDSDRTSGKSLRYLEFSEALVYAVPNELAREVKPLLPDVCGLMARGPNGWRTVQRPTIQRVDSLPEHVMLKLLIDGIERERRAYRARQFDAVHEAQRRREEFGDLVAKAIARPEQVEHELRMLEHRYELRKKELEDSHSYVKERALRELREAAELLGMPAESATWGSVSRRLDELVTQADSDERVQHAERELEVVRSTLQRALERVDKQIGSEPFAASGELKGRAA